MLPQQIKQLCKGDLGQVLGVLQRGYGFLKSFKYSNKKIFNNARVTKLVPRILFYLQFLKVFQSIV